VVLKGATFWKIDLSSQQALSLIMVSKVSFDGQSQHARYFNGVDEKKLLFVLISDDFVLALRHGNAT